MGARRVNPWFIVRVVDVRRETFTVVCEACGEELPFGLNLIDSTAIGLVMVEHTHDAHSVDAT